LDTQKTSSGILRNRSEEQLMPLEINFDGNPHALLIDGVVTEVVYMSDRTPEEITDYLTQNHEYTEVVRCADYPGWPIAFVGHTWHDYLDEKRLMYAMPYKNWVLTEFAIWEPPMGFPVEPPTDEWHYHWDEEIEDFVKYDSETHKLLDCCSATAEGEQK
jgi:hypothetical protein